MSPTYGGLQLFGAAVHVDVIPNANAAQLASFFGVQGVQAMDGGMRGRAFEVRGLMIGFGPAAVLSGMTQLSQFADGVARIFVDTTGTAWANVVYRNEFQWSDKYMFLCDGTGRTCRPYRCILHGLS